MAKRSKKAVIATADYKYPVLSIRGKDGKIRYSTGNADAVAKAMLLHVANGGTTTQAAKANGLKIGAKGGNEGTLRMSVGVALRGLIRHGTPVKIGKLNIKSLRQSVALPKVETKAAPAKATKKAGKAKSKRKAPKPRARRVEAPANVPSEPAAPPAG